MLNVTSGRPRPNPVARRVRFRPLVIALFVVALVTAVSGWVAAPSASAQGAAAVDSEGAQREIRHAQYMFLIDDSKSMWSTDPDRLAVFATRSMLEVLDDGDEISLVRLNSVIDKYDSDGDESFRPVREARAALRARLDKADKKETLGAYQGRATPCTEAFKGVKDRLNAAYQKGTRQVLIYLTDGACENLNNQKDTFDPKAFTTGLKSWKQEEKSERDFLFYALFFNDSTQQSKTDFSHGLEKLADDSSGGHFPADNKNAMDLVAVFARALSQAQGYDTLQLKPGANKLGANSAASRVRLLAVAEGGGPDLELDFGAAHPKLVEAAQKGTHAFVVPATIRGQKNYDGHDYADGKPYRFIKLSYAPDPSVKEFQVTVKNAERWSVVAIPEYHLKLKASARSGKCKDAGATIARGSAVTIDGSKGTAAELCLAVRLVNEADQDVDRDTFSGEVQMSITESAGGQAGPAPATSRAQVPRLTGRFSFSM